MKKEFANWDKWEAKALKNKSPLPLTNAPQTTATDLTTKQLLDKQNFLVIGRRQMRTPDCANRQVQTRVQQSTGRENGDRQKIGKNQVQSAASQERPQHHIIKNKVRTNTKTYLVNKQQPELIVQAESIRGSQDSTHAYISINENENGHLNPQQIQNQYQKIHSKQHKLTTPKTKKNLQQLKERLSNLLDHSSQNNQVNNTEKQEERGFKQPSPMKVYFKYQKIENSAQRQNQKKEFENFSTEHFSTVQNNEDSANNTYSALSSERRKTVMSPKVKTQLEDSIFEVTSKQRTRPGTNLQLKRIVPDTVPDTHRMQLKANNANNFLAKLQIDQDLKQQMQRGQMALDAKLYTKTFQNQRKSTKPMDSLLKTFDLNIKPKLSQVQNSNAFVTDRNEIDSIYQISGKDDDPLQESTQLQERVKEVLKYNHYARSNYQSRGRKRKVNMKNVDNPQLPNMGIIPIAFQAQSNWQQINSRQLVGKPVNYLDKSCNKTQYRIHSTIQTTNQIAINNNIAMEHSIEEPFMNLESFQTQNLSSRNDNQSHTYKSVVTKDRNSQGRSTLITGHSIKTECHRLEKQGLPQVISIQKPQHPLPTPDKEVQEFNSETATPIQPFSPPNQTSPPDLKELKDQTGLIVTSPTSRMVNMSTASFPSKDSQQLPWQIQAQILHNQINQQTQISQTTGLVIEPLTAIKPILKSKRQAKSVTPAIRQDAAVTDGAAAADTADGVTRNQGIDSLIITNSFKSGQKQLQYQGQQPLPPPSQQGIVDDCEYDEQLKQVFNLYFNKQQKSLEASTGIANKTIVGEEEINNQEEQIRMSSRGQKRLGEKYQPYSSINFADKGQQQDSKDLQNPMDNLEEFYMLEKILQEGSNDDKQQEEATQDPIETISEDWNRLVNLYQFNETIKKIKMGPYSSLLRQNLSTVGQPDFHKVLGQSLTPINMTQTTSEDQRGGVKTKNQIYKIKNKRDAKFYRDMLTKFQPIKDYKSEFKLNPSLRSKIYSDTLNQNIIHD